MRRLQIVYAVGWATVTVAALAIAPLGLLAATLCVVLIAATLLLGYLATAPRTSRLIVGDRQVAKPSGCPSSLGALERVQLVRIINLCRIVAAPRGEALLLTELHEVLAGGQLAGWAPLLDLQDLLVRESSRLIPFGSGCEENVLESRC